MFTSYANKGNVDLSQFSRVEHGHWTYWSVFNCRTYDLELVQKEDHKFYWWCNCSDARHISHPCGKQCKHEIALARMIKSKYDQKCMAEIEAEQIIDEAQERTKQSEVAQLRAEVASLRTELETLYKKWQKADLQTAEALSKFAWQTNEHINAIKAENTEFKCVLATKATARKKHQSETESAQIKKDMNQLFADVTSAAQTTIQTTAMLKDRLASLETIPHELKRELDSWTERGKEELQPDYQAPDHNAPEIKSLVRGMQEAERERREATPEERRTMAPLNGNSGFNFYR